MLELHDLQLDVGRPIVSLQVCKGLPVAPSTFLWAPDGCNAAHFLRHVLSCRSVELAKDTYLSSAFAGWITGMRAWTAATL